MLLALALYFVLGAFAGVIAGLFGVGGGVVIVPALVYAFAKQGVDAAILTHMAVGTSLAVICVTSVSSVRTHHKNGFVLWPVVKVMAPGSILGVMLGVYTVVQIPGVVLQLVIGSFLLLVSVQMGFQLMPAGERPLPSSAGLFSAGGFIGWVSAMFGIGGGSLTVPLLSFFGTRMQMAVATSAACGMPIAFAGAISNMVAGWGNGLTPAWSLGFVYLPAFFGIALMSAPFANVGAQLAKKLPAQVLKRLFAVFLVIIGSLMILRATGVA